MQNFDLYSMWLGEDGVVNSIFEGTIKALGSVDAAIRFAQYEPEKLRMGKFSVFYYTRESANAALIAKQRKFVNLIMMNIPPMELDTPPIVPIDIEYEIVKDSDIEETEEDEKTEEVPIIVEEESQLSPVPDECDLMTMQEFIDSVKDGLFVDDDGHGRYANSMMMSPELIYPSDVIKGVVLEGWTHVAWFNK
jgi:hypothetical protein